MPASRDIGTRRCCPPAFRAATGETSQLPSGEWGRTQLGRAWQNGQQLIQANGTSYNVSDELHGSERRWPLDPIPLVIAENEWIEIERAVIQRATLLNAVLADLYGPQQLLHQQWIPPALVFANPHFLRPCHGIEPRGGVHLHSYAADLARSPDGHWWVTSDRTQAPSGIGYTLENRLVSARTLPQRVQRVPCPATGHASLI